MRNLIYLMMFGAALSSPGRAAQMTVGDLLTMCTSSDQGDKVACTFYILGVTEGSTVAGNSAADGAGVFHELKDKTFCVPDNISSQALELVVKMKMGEDVAVFPKDREMPAVSFVMAVMRSNFACAKVKTP